MAILKTKNATKYSDKTENLAEQILKASVIAIIKNNYMTEMSLEFKSCLNCRLIEIFMFWGKSYNWFQYLYFNVCVMYFPVFRNIDEYNYAELLKLNIWH